MVPSGEGGEPGSRAGVTDPAGSEASARSAIVEARVRAEQVRTLFKQSAPVLFANVFNALILSAALWAETSHALLLGWTAAMTAMVLARVQLRRAFWAVTPGTADHDRWGRLYTWGSGCAGLLWGVAGGALQPDSLPHQVVVVFVVGGMAAGAAATISCFMPAYTAYVLPAMVPTVLRLFTFGGEAHLAMGVTLALFTLVLTAVARNVNESLSRAFRLGFENADLVSQLSRSNELLEGRVAERTAELHQSQERLAEIVRESPDGLVILDESGVITSTNPAAERLSGQLGPSIVGKSFAEIEMLSAGEIARATESLQKIIAGERQPPQEFELTLPEGGKLFVEVNPRVVFGVDGKPRIHAVVRDVTERHRVERLKAEYEARSRQAQRLEAVGMLAGGVAHDFNNLLTMILNNIDSLQKGTHDESVRELLLEIRQGSLEAADLTKQLLAFSRKQMLDVKPASLTHVLQRARPILERIIGERSRLTLALGDEPAVVLADAGQLEQAIINLLANSRDAMPRGGQVEIEVRRVRIEADRDWPEVRPGDYVRVSVTDDGDGMDEATCSRVFDPFFTTKGLGHGAGLGLSTVHGIVSQAGGHIRVTSRVGAGSRFEILLPVHVPAEGTSILESVPPPRVEAWTPGHETVLLVEDHPQVQRATRRILAAAGYAVLSADNGQHALEVSQKHAGAIDVLITDFVMPGLSGVELARKLTKERPGIAVLLISGYTGSELTLRAELGPDAFFLQKPFDAASLTASTRAALDHASSRAPERQKKAGTDSGSLQA